MNHSAVRELLWTAHLVDHSRMAGARDTKISATLGTALMLVLGACGQEGAPAPATPAPPVPAKTVVQPKKGPSVDELTSGMVQATPLGRSAVQLDVKFDLGDKPVKGRPFELNIALIPLDAANQTTVTVSGSQGFEGLDARQFEFDHMDVGEVYRHTLKMTPSSEGVQLVGLSVTLSQNDVTETKEFSIPVIVGH